MNTESKTSHTGALPDDSEGLRHVRPPHETLKCLNSGITYVQYLFDWSEDAKVCNMSKRHNKSKEI